MNKTDYNSFLSNQIKHLKIEGKELDISQYSSIKNEITNETILIDSLLSFDEYLNCINGLDEYFDFTDLIPFAEILGGSLLAIGLNDLKDEVLYIDFDFGIFSLGESIETVSKKLYLPKE